MNGLVQWLNTQTENHMVLGYGSLLSRDSRERFSNIFTQGIPVTVAGFERAWVTRSEQEKQTYVGAVANGRSKLNAQLIPTQISPALQEREKDYRFVEVSPQDLNFHLEKSGFNKAQHTQDEGHSIEGALAQFTYWICETLFCVPASEAFPVYQTYIDTCMAGCLEHGGKEEAERFVGQTSLWAHPRVNDRASPKYPRAAKVRAKDAMQIDKLLTHR